MGQTSDGGVDGKKLRALADADLEKARRVAQLAHELRCEITIGHITARPVGTAAPPSEQARGLLAVLKAPVLAFFERL